MLSDENTVSNIIKRIYEHIGNNCVITHVSNWFQHLLNLAYCGSCTSVGNIILSDMDQPPLA